MRSHSGTPWRFGRRCTLCLSSRLRTSTRRTTSLQIGCRWPKGVPSPGRWPHHTRAGSRSNRRSQGGRHRRYRWVSRNSRRSRTCRQRQRKGARRGGESRGCRRGERWRSMDGAVYLSLVARGDIARAGAPPPNIELSAPIPGGAVNGLLRPHLLPLRLNTGRNEALIFSCTRTGRGCLQLEAE